MKILKLRKNNLRYLDDAAFFGLDSIEQLYLDRNQVIQIFFNLNLHFNKICADVTTKGLNRGAFQFITFPI